MQRSLLILFLAFVLAVAAGCTCGDDDDDSIQADDDTGDDDVDDDADDDADDDCQEAPPSDNEHTLLGLSYLEAAAGGLARVEFLAALEDDPDDLDAQFGRVLAGTLMEFDTLSVIVTYAHMLLEGFDPLEKSGRAKDEDDSLQSLIDALLDSALENLVLRFTDEINEWGPPLFDVECLSLELDVMPIIIYFQTVARPGGDDWDESEVSACLAFTNVFGGLIRLMTVLDFDLDVSRVLALGDINWDSYSTAQIVSILVDVLDNVLNDPAFPDFLTMDEDGLSDFRKVQFEMGLGFRYAHGTLDILRSETDDQADDIMAYADVNQNNKFDVFDHYVFPYWGELDAGQMAEADAWEEIFRALGDSLLDRTQYDLDPQTDTPFDIAEFNALLWAGGMPAFLPSVQIDLASPFEEATPDGLRNGLRTIAALLSALLPAPPPY